MHCIVVPACLRMPYCLQDKGSSPLTTFFVQDNRINGMHRREGNFRRIRVRRREKREHEGGKRVMGEEEEM